jgi:hypothetical protein
MLINDTLCPPLVIKTSEMALPALGASAVGYTRKKVSSDPSSGFALRRSPMKAAIYARVSLEDGGQTVENQRQQLTAPL